MNRRALTWLVAPFFAAMLAGCDAEQTEEGDLPDVDVKGGDLPDVDVDVKGGDMPDVDVQGGNLPKYDVDAPDVDVKGGDLPDVDVQGGDLPDVEINEPEAEGSDPPSAPASGTAPANPPAE
jgi:hypothetical protein